MRQQTLLESGKISYTGTMLTTEGYLTTAALTVIFARKSNGGDTGYRYQSCESLETGVVTRHINCNPKKSRFLKGLKIQGFIIQIIRNAYQSHLFLL